MNQLLLELFSEEIPSRMQEKAAKELLESLLVALNNIGLKPTESDCFSTPRRIAIFIDGIPSEVEAKSVEKKGPKIDAKAEAISGFLKSVKMRLEDLEVKDGFYFAKKLEMAKSTDSFLAEIINQILLSFTWPKSMRVDSSRHRWIRPLRNILCIFSGKILPVKFLNIEANNISFGHRFMSPEEFKISSFEEYITKIKSHNVILSSKERKEFIKNKAEEIASRLFLKAVIDQSLLDEVSGLVELPNVLLGKIDQEFTSLPKEVLVTAMKVHQRYFYLEDKNGNIAPYFIFVANVNYENNNLIIEGNEKVLKARLADAKFFWELDIKNLATRSSTKLAQMTFHSKLGSMLDKTNRIQKLSEFIAYKLQFTNLEAVQKVAILAKNDLVSEMVGEFPELQGVMGKYYAQESGENKEICLAISEHYRPTDANDIGDISYLGAIIAISDKLDTITGLWFAGEKPTSSKDPFALRRAALGVIKLIRHHKMHLSLVELLQMTVQAYNFTPNVYLEKEIVIFFHDRLKFYLKSEGFRHDLILAALSEENTNIYGSIQKVEAIQDYVKKANSNSLIFAIKRVHNIIDSYNGELGLNVHVNLLTEPESTLYMALQDIRIVNSPEDLEHLVPLIDKFFEEVLVNATDLKLKLNRLNLLNNVITVSQKIADFKLIEA